MSSVWRADRRGERDMRGHHREGRVFRSVGQQKNPRQEEGGQGAKQQGEALFYKSQEWVCYGSVGSFAGMVLGSILLIEVPDYPGIVSKMSYYVPGTW